MSSAGRVDEEFKNVPRGSALGDHIVRRKKFRVALMRPTHARWTASGKEPGIQEFAQAGVVHRKCLKGSILLARKLRERHVAVRLKIGFRPGPDCISVREHRHCRDSAGQAKTLI